MTSLATITHETIIKTREFFRDNAMACIAEVKSGEVKVNNPDAYYRWREQSAIDAMSGKYDGTVSFLQRALYIQTGECLAILPK